jgi:hypothetical protein
MIFQGISLFIILLSFWVLSKGRQNSQSTTMLRNECAHTFLYVFGHCGEYMLGLLLILISKSWGVGGGVPALLSISVVCVYVGLLELAHPELTFFLLLSGI